MDVKGNTRGDQGEVQYLDWDIGEPNWFGCVMVHPNNAGPGNWVTHWCTGQHMYVCATG